MMVPALLLMMPGQMLPAKELDMLLLLQLLLLMMVPALLLMMPGQMVAAKELGLLVLQLLLMPYRHHAV